jgi:cell division protein FtsB
MNTNTADELLKISLERYHDINESIKQLQREKRRLDRENPQLKHHYNGYKNMVAPSRAYIARYNKFIKSLEDTGSD